MRCVADPSVRFRCGDIVLRYSKVVPFALGRDVTFEDREGPLLAPIDSVDGLDLDSALWAKKLAPVYEAVKLVRSRLDRKTAL